MVDGAGHGSTDWDLVCSNEGVASLSSGSAWVSLPHQPEHSFL